ncbi:MAG: putative membrane protein [Pseudomonadales bacterium]|jgi:uncharacterized membrane protein
MNKIKWLVAILLLAWVGQYGVAMLAPNLIMQALYRAVVDLSGENNFALTPLPDETTRGVVRPSPDLFYGICAYNVESGPVSIEALVPEKYWSMQFYQINTDNFSSFSNQRDESYRVNTTAKITLINASDDASNYQGDVVRSPTDKGVMLIRVSAIGDQAQQMAALNLTRCSVAVDTE